jgi:hypothetical protein
MIAKTMTATGALALSLCLLAGCASDRKTISRDATAPAVATAGTPGCHAARMKCFVDVIETEAGCKFRFDPDVLKVRPTHKRFVIVWRLPEGFVFLPALGDGVTFTKEPPGDEFEDGYTTDSEDGDPPTVTKGHRRFRWVYVNDVPMKLYHYRIQFHRKNDPTRAIVCDPAISNLGDQ